MAKKKNQRVVITISEEDRDKLNSAISAHYSRMREDAIKNLKAAVKDGSYTRAGEEIENLNAIDNVGDLYLDDLDVDWNEPGTSTDD